MSYILSQESYQIAVSDVTCRDG